MRIAGEERICVSARMPTVYLRYVVIAYIHAAIARQSHGYVSIWIHSGAHPAARLTSVEQVSSFPPPKTGDLCS